MPAQGLPNVESVRCLRCHPSLAAVDDLGRRELGLEPQVAAVGVLIWR